MKIQIHKLDFHHAAQLNETRKKIDGEVDAGKLKLGDVWLGWKKGSDYLTLQSKDILL